ncbi:helix-turn-helix transcriptional regulator [Paenibacillus sp. GCM10027627]|uniref:helix-turn-helix transcriptional regulator n=1 Tax=unclassified Paenibacillus TaxID=185978 RepID=UPI003636C012
MSKADTMLSILWLLRSGRKLTAKQLADELEIHIRTVYRCIDSLCASGAPIMAEPGPNGGYQMIGRFADAPLMFDMEEQKALVQASAFAEAAGYPFTEALERAMEKLKRYTNGNQLERMERHKSGLSVISTSSSGQDGFLQLLEQAASDGLSLEMVYDKGRGDAKARAYDPYAIVHWKGKWYTAGFCRLRNDLRSFRVDRILKLEPSERRFERPASFSAKQFMLGQLLPDVSQGHNLVRVVIKAHEQVLNELQGHWLFGHALTERVEGEAYFSLASSSLLTYVPYYLLPYGKALTILEPDELIHRLAQIGEELALHYKTMLSESHSADKGEF